MPYATERGRLLEGHPVGDWKAPRERVGDHSLVRHGASAGDDARYRLPDAEHARAENILANLRDDSRELASGDEG